MNNAGRASNSPWTKAKIWKLLTSWQTYALRKCDFRPAEGCAHSSHGVRFVEQHDPTAADAVLAQELSEQAESCARNELFSRADKPACVQDQPRQRTRLTHSSARQRRHFHCSFACLGLVFGRYLEGSAMAIHLRRRYYHCESGTSLVSKSAAKT